MTVFTATKTRGKQVSERATYYESEQADQAGYDDYYLKAGADTQSASFCGSALAVAGIKEGDKPKPGDYEKLFNGYRIDNGEDFLTEKKRKDLENNNRIHGFSCAFSIDKSISVFYASASKEQQAAILRAMQKAADNTVRYAEQQGKFTVGSGHARQGEREKVSIMAACYSHITSRSVDGAPPDPQLHTHLEIANYGITESGEIRALDAHDSIFKRQAELRAIHDVDFYSQLEKEGIDTSTFENDFMGYGLKTKAVSDAQKEAHSKRRQQILDELGGRTEASARAKSKANLSSRTAKDYEIDYEELHASWRESIGELDLDAKGNRKPPTKLEVENVLFKGKSVSTINDLERTAAQLAIGDPRGLVAIEEKKQEIIRELDVIYCKDPDKITTKEFVKMEGELLRYAIRQRESVTHSISDKEIEKGIKRFEKRKTDELKEIGINAKFELNPEQEKAVYHLSKGGLAIMQGAAGTGKSATLGAIQEIYKANGYTVTGLAPSGKAAEGLASDGIDNAQTVHKLLLQVESGKRILTSKDILLFDEAGMADTRTLHALTYYAQKAGAKLLLSGDGQQLEAVGSASTFSMLAHEDAAGSTELSRIARQNHAEDRAIAQAWLKGRPGEAWAMSKARVSRDGRPQVLACGTLTPPDPNDPDDVRNYEQSAAALIDMHSDPSAPSALEAAAAGYLKDLRTSESEGGNGGDVLLLADSRANVGALNKLIRADRIEKGEVNDENGLDFKFDLGRGHYRDERIAEGDRVMFRKPDRELGVVNGTTGKIIGKGQQTGEKGAMVDVLLVQLDNGKTTEVSAAYQGIELSYATTVHKSQGMTVNFSHYLASDIASRRAAYVAGTRAREAHTTYLDADNAGRIQAGVQDFTSKETAIHAVKAGYEKVALQEWEAQAQRLEMLLDEEESPDARAHLAEILDRIDGLQETIQRKEQQSVADAKAPAWIAQGGGFNALSGEDQNKARAAHSLWQAGNPTMRTFDLDAYVSYVQERHALQQAREPEPQQEPKQQQPDTIALMSFDAVSKPRMGIIPQMELAGPRMPQTGATLATPGQAVDQPANDEISDRRAYRAEKARQGAALDRAKGEQAQAQHRNQGTVSETVSVDITNNQRHERKRTYIADTRKRNRYIEQKQEKNSWADEQTQQADHEPSHSNDGPEM